ncbi:MAG: DUF1549 and DUF1553 domain-containing protein [Pirellulaceae bacterium]
MTRLPRLRTIGWMLFVFVGGGAIGSAKTFASAAETLPPVSERFAADDVTETPDFQRHVVPLLGRLGCNGRACHGSFQGQGGFALSLFGYDFASDHQAIVGDADYSRIDRHRPRKSLLLQKPTLETDHEGGLRLPSTGWQQRLVTRWIEDGAQPIAEQAAELVRLEIEPAELLFRRAGESESLRAVAVWSDGTREDVTPLCRFQTNDDSIATVDADGRVVAVGPGDTHVVAFYDNGVAAVPVLQPFSNQTGDAYPDVPAHTRVDELVVEKLRKLGVVPSPICEDHEFLRRASLDITGTLPTPAEVREFLADTSPNKRSRKIDELLERPTYAAWWATRLSDWTGNAESNGPVGSEQGLRRRYSEQWHAWLERRLADNVPYDQIVAGIVLATSREPDQSFDQFCAEMSSYFRAEQPSDFAARATMPHFWSRRSLGPEVEKARAFAYSFLGVRLECAQCHKHPFDQWTKDDFDQFAEFFVGVRYGPRDRSAYLEMKESTELKGLDEDSGNYKRRFVAMVERGEVAPFKEVSVPSPSPNRSSAKRRPNKRLGRVITPRLLGDEEVLTDDYGDPRQPLMDWLREADNPYFARALVNRVWASYFGTGLVEPPDDMNLANPPSNAPLLDYLSSEFVSRGFDLRWLHREIVNSDAYQRSWRPNDTNQRDERNHSRFVVRRLPAEVLYDAATLATASNASQLALNNERSELLKRAIGPSSGFAGTREEMAYATNLFGQPERELNCDCERSNSPNLQQTLYFRNDDAVAKLIERRDGWLAENFANKKTDAPLADVDSLIQDAYLRTVSRPANDREIAAARKYLSEAATSKAGLRDLMWALLNTKEFLVNH